MELLKPLFPSMIVPNQQWLNNLTQRYGYHALVATAQEQGFDVEEEETLADGTVRVVVGRWV